MSNLVKFINAADLDEAAKLLVEEARKVVKYHWPVAAKIVVIIGDPLERIHLCADIDPERPGAYGFERHQT